MEPVPAVSGDQSGGLEHLEMLRDRRLAHRELVGEFQDPRIAAAQTSKDRPASRIGHRAEHSTDVDDLGNA